MKYLIFGLIAIVGFTNAYVIQLPGQCPKESELNLDSVIFNAQDLAGTFYTILTANFGPYAGVSSTRTISYNPDGTMHLEEEYLSFSGQVHRVKLNITAVPDTRGYTLNRGVEGYDEFTDFLGYMIYVNPEKDLYIGYCCRQVSEDLKEEDLAVWSGTKTRVDEEILEEVQNTIKENNMFDIYNFLQIVQQPCCHVDTGYCNA